MAVAVNETTGRAYVANHDSNNVTVIDGKSRSVAATVQAGAGPEGIAVNPATNRVYVANAGDSTVTVIDGATNRVVATVRSGGYSQAVAVLGAANRVYAANNSGHSATVIDGVTHAGTTFRVGQGPRAVAVNAAANKIYTVNYGSDDVTEIDGATNTTVSIPTGRRPWAIAVDSKSNRIYVAHVVGGTLFILDGATGARRSIAVGDTAFAVAANPETGRAYVLCYSPKTMVVVDGASGTVAKTVALPARPSAIAVNAKTNRIYVALQGAASVAVIDGASLKIAETVRTGAIPYAMAVDTVLNQVYVANFGGDSATVIPGAGAQSAKFRVLALAESAAGDHQGFVEAAKTQLSRLAAEHGFAVDYVTDTEGLNGESLGQYNLFLQLNYPPYRWAPAAKRAFEKSIAQGRVGWIGFHHAALLGEFDGYPMDRWFSEFLGGIRYKNYLADFARATVRVEDRAHPLMKGLPDSFVVEREEWYTWDRSPRPNVRVLATVDEASYVPDARIKMGGDHPVVWSNPHVKARNAYVFMGHHAGLFENAAFAQLFRNAVLWGAGQ
jgi:hypothetical protein